MSQLCLILEIINFNQLLSCHLSLYLDNTVSLMMESELMTQPLPDDRLLKALAVAFVDRPRATLKELAEAAGISKATLHRLCGTRDNLVEMLMAHGLTVLNQVIQRTDLDNAEPLTALKRLIQEHLAHRELLMFLMFQYRPDSLDPANEGAKWIPYDSALDAFFLRGQRAGLFRIEVGAPVLTELFLSLIYGIVDAERRGRAASASSAGIIEQFFLQGAGVRGN